MAGKKAATTRKRRAAGRKAARTRKHRAAGRKAAVTRKSRLLDPDHSLAELSVKAIIEHLCAHEEFNGVVVSSVPITDRHGTGDAVLLHHSERISSEQVERLLNGAINVQTGNIEPL